MEQPKELVLTIKETKEYKVRVSEENGYDAFPDNILGMTDYINTIKANPSSYIGSGADGVAVVLEGKEVTLSGIEVVGETNE